MRLNFSTKNKTAETIAMLKVCARSLQTETITEFGIEFICEAIEDYIKIKQARSLGGQKSSGGGRPKKYKTDTERKQAQQASVQKYRAKKAS